MLKKTMGITVIICLSLQLCGCGSSLAQVIEQTGMTEAAIIAAYADAESAFDSRDFESAIDAYEEIVGYKDSEKKLKKAKDQYVTSVMQDVDICVNTEDFDDALDLIEAARYVVGDIERLDAAESDVILKYKASVFAVSEKYVTNGNYDVALSVLSELEKRIGEDTEITVKVQEIEKAKTENLKA